MGLYLDNVVLKDGGVYGDAVRRVEDYSRDGDARVQNSAFHSSTSESCEGSPALKPEPFDHFKMLIPGDQGLLVRNHDSSDEDIELVDHLPLGLQL